MITKQVYTSRDLYDQIATGPMVVLLLLVMVLLLLLLLQVVMLIERDLLVLESDHLVPRRGGWPWRPSESGRGRA